jgi:DNA repair protein RadC
MQDVLEVSGDEEWMAWDFESEPVEAHSTEDRILRAAGAESLNDQELVATVLGIDVASAHDLLELHTGELLRLFSRGSLASFSLSPAHRAQFLAVRELACRLAAERIPPKDPLCRPEDIARYLSLRYGARDQETFGALFLSNAGTVIQHSEIYRGTLDCVRVEPREVLKQALLVGAAVILVFHNHPSGDATPSADDTAFTKNLANAAQILGIRLADHLVLGASGTWTSLRDFMAW